MVEIKSDCIILDGVVCPGDFHMFCTRGIYSYWREIWLERVDAPQDTSRRSCVATAGAAPEPWRTPA